MKKALNALVIASALITGSAQAREFLKAKTVVYVTHTDTVNGTEKLLKSKGTLIVSDDGVVCEVTLKSGVIPCQYQPYHGYVISMTTAVDVLCSGQSWCKPLKAAAEKSNQGAGLFSDSETRVQLHTDNVREAFHVEFDVSKLKKM